MQNLLKVSEAVPITTAENLVFCAHFAYSCRWNAKAEYLLQELTLTFPKPRQNLIPCIAYSNQWRREVSNWSPWENGLQNLCPAFLLGQKQNRKCFFFFFCYRNMWLLEKPSSVLEWSSASDGGSQRRKLVKGKSISGVRLFVLLLDCGIWADLA